MEVADFLPLRVSCKSSCSGLCTGLCLKSSFGLLTKTPENRAKLSREVAENSHHQTLFSRDQISFMVLNDDHFLFSLELNLKEDSRWL